MKKLIYTIIIFFIFISTPKAIDLTIINIQDDNTSNTYTYKLNVYNASGAYQYTYQNKDSYLVFDGAGNTTFTLNQNETITIKNLPESTYQIEQNINNNYITFTNDSKTNLLNSSTNIINTITFNNKTKKAPNPNTGAKETIILIIIFTIIIILSFLKTKKIKRYY